MEQPNILVTIPKGPVFDSFFTEELIERLLKLGNVTWNESHRQFTKEELRDRLKGTDICLTGWGTPQFDEESLSLADRLRLIAHDAGTVKPMVNDVAFERGIRVCSGNPVFARSVAEGAVSYMLAALRRIPYYTDAVKAGQWPDPAGTRGLLNRSVGLVGYGMIAQYLADMLKAFGCRIKVFSRHMPAEELLKKGLEPASMLDIFQTCDIISLHQGLTGETRRSVGRDFLRSLKDGALLVNTARGGLIDEEALADIAEQGNIYAVLDVFEQEPLPMDSKLRRLKNVMLMPHCAGPTEDRRVHVTEYLLDDIERFLRGETLKCEIDAGRARKMTTLVK